MTTPTPAGALDVERLSEAAAEFQVLRAEPGRRYTVSNDSHIKDIARKYAALSPQPEVSVTPGLRALAETLRHVRRVGFPVHRGDDECYCDTCWEYLAEDNGGDPERAALAESPVTPDLRAVGIERFMVVLRPWLGMHDDVMLERACRTIRRALTYPDPEAEG